LGQVVKWLQGKSTVAVHRLLKRLGFGWKRALNFVRSPDPNFRTKWQAILRAYAQALANPRQIICLFLDEFTYYRQPCLAPAYHPQGQTQPHARQLAGYNTCTRLVAALNALSGQVIYRQRKKIGKEELLAFFAQLRAAYPQAACIYLVMDNWPVHQLPEVLAALAEHRLTPLFLPTYASWLNPIEKLWRWLKQDVLHLHRLAQDLPALRQEVTDFLDQFQHGSTDLLHYVGLLPE
jgi:transposase